MHSSLSLSLYMYVSISLSLSTSLSFARSLPFACTPTHSPDDDCQGCLRETSQPDALRACSQITFFERLCDPSELCRYHHMRLTVFFGFGIPFLMQGALILDRHMPFASAEDSHSFGGHGKTRLRLQPLLTMLIFWWPVLHLALAFWPALHALCRSSSHAPASVVGPTLKIFSSFWLLR